MRQRLDVNGLEIDAGFDDSQVNSVFIPLLTRWTDLQKRLSRRIIIFLAAPPGCGKSTLSLFLEGLSNSLPGIIPLQTLGMDGFHYPESYLRSHNIEGTSDSLSLIKGAPETFNVEYLRSKLDMLLISDPLWPVYDRNLHDVIPDRLRITGRILLLEGNYLLLNETPWDELFPYCDDSIFLSADPSVLKKRLFSRKMQGGSSEEEAAAHVENVDMPNVWRVLEHSRKAPVTLLSEEDYSFRILSGPI